MPYSKKQMKIARVAEPRDKITREDLMILRQSKKKGKKKGGKVPHLDDSWPPDNVPEIYEKGSNLSITGVIKEPALELNPVEKAKKSAQVPNAVINRFTGAVSDDAIMEKNIFYFEI